MLVMSLFRPCVESLEDRLAPAVNLHTVFVIPVSQPVDSTHFHTLTDALAVAPDVVTIEPGASPDPVAEPITVDQDSITIQGDANVPASILPAYRIRATASEVTLTNLNLMLLNMDGGAENSVSKCLINSI